MNSRVRKISSDNDIDIAKPRHMELYKKLFSRNHINFINTYLSMKKDDLFTDAEFVKNMCLFYAAGDGQLEVVDFLLKEGANINSMLIENNQNITTVYSITVEGGHYKLADYLASKGANTGVIKVTP
jgi:ankyrin repeat protein